MIDNSQYMNYQNLDTNCMDSQHMDSQHMDSQHMDSSQLWLNHDNLNSNMKDDSDEHLWEETISPLAMSCFAPSVDPCHMDKSQLPNELSEMKRQLLDELKSVADKPWSGWWDTLHEEHKEGHDQPNVMSVEEDNDMNLSDEGIIIN